MTYKENSNVNAHMTTTESGNVESYAGSQDNYPVTLVLVGCYREFGRIILFDNICLTVTCFHKSAQKCRLIVHARTPVFKTMRTGLPRLGAV